MPIRPKPFKVVCEQCGWSKIIHPNSDVVDASWFSPKQCPKCNSSNFDVVSKLNILDSFLLNIKEKLSKF